MYRRHGRTPAWVNILARARCVCAAASLSLLAFGCGDDDTAPDDSACEAQPTRPEPECATDDLLVTWTGEPTCSEEDEAWIFESTLTDCAALDGDQRCQDGACVERTPSP